MLPGEQTQCKLFYRILKNEWWNSLRTILLFLFEHVASVLKQEVRAVRGDATYYGPRPQIFLALLINADTDALARNEVEDYTKSFE